MQKGYSKLKSQREIDIAISKRSEKGRKDKQHLMYSDKTYLTANSNGQANKQSIKRRKNNTIIYNDKKIIIEIILYSNILNIMHCTSCTYFIHSKKRRKHKHLTCSTTFVNSNTNGNYCLDHKTRR